MFRVALSVWWRGMNCVSFSEQNGGNHLLEPRREGSEGTVVQTSDKRKNVGNELTVVCRWIWERVDVKTCSQLVQNLTLLTN